MRAPSSRKRRAGPGARKGAAREGARGAEGSAGAGPEGRGRRPGGAERPATRSLTSASAAGGSAGARGAGSARRRDDRGVEPGPSGHESAAPPARQEGEGTSWPLSEASPSARVCVRAPPARRGRPPPGAAGSGPAGMPPLLASLLCLALLPALGARGRRPPPASPQTFRALRKLWRCPTGAPGVAGSGRPGWGGREPGVLGRGWVGRGTTGVRGWGRRADPLARRPPLEPGLKPAWGAERLWRPSPGLALLQQRVGLAAGAGELPTAFRFESSRFWFPVASGATYLSSSSLARARGGCWGAECGVRSAAFAFVEPRRPARCGAWCVGNRARGGPGLPTPLGGIRARAGARGADPGPRGSWGSCVSGPPVSPPHVGSLPSTPAYKQFGGWRWPVCGRLSRDW